MPMSPRLRVGDHRDVGRDRRPEPLEGGQAGRPERLEERQVRLDGRGVRGGGLEDERGEPLDAREVRG